MDAMTANSKSLLVNLPACAAIALVVAAVTFGGSRAVAVETADRKTKPSKIANSASSEPSPGKFTARQIASLQKSLVNNIVKPVFFCGRIAVNLPCNCSPFSPLNWLQVWHRPPCGIIIVPIFSRRGAARPRQLIFDAEMFEKIEADEDLKRRVRSMEDPSLGKPSRYDGGVL